jgi:hypothetical protein
MERKDGAVQEMLSKTQSSLETTEPDRTRGVPVFELPDNSLLELTGAGNVLLQRLSEKKV